MVLWNFPRLVGLGLAGRTTQEMDSLPLPTVACSRLLCSVSQPRCPHSVLPSPTDPDSMNKTPYIFQLSTFFPNLVVITPSLLRTHYFPAGS